MQTICGTDVKYLSKKPSPEELGQVIAHWNSEDQAKFFSALGEELRNCSGNRVAMQWQYIADSIQQLEEKLCDGSASQLIDEINQRLKAEVV